jgi:hypothetical protein
MSEDLRKPLWAAILLITAIVYFGVQWTGASTIAGSKIFSPSGDIDRAEFAGMVRAMSEAAHRACGAHASRKLLFADGDIVMPYLPVVHDTLDGCELEGELLITQFSKSELEDCNAVFIREVSPNYAFGFGVDSRRRGIPDARVQGIPWTEVERWRSTSGMFGFALYGHPCADGKT